MFKIKTFGDNDAYNIDLTLTTTLTYYDLYSIVEHYKKVPENNRR